MWYTGSCKLFSIKKKKKLFWVFKIFDWVSLIKMKIGWLDYSILPSSAWYCLDFEKWNEQKVESSAKLQEFILSLWKKSWTKKHATLDEYYSYKFPKYYSLAFGRKIIMIKSRMKVLIWCNYLILIFILNINKWYILK